MCKRPNAVGVHISEVFRVCHIIELEIRWWGLGTRRERRMGVRLNSYKDLVLQDEKDSRDDGRDATGYGECE